MRADNPPAEGTWPTRAQDRPVELTNDPGFARRIVRLALTSCVALGLVWWLAITTLEAHPATGISLAAGWLLMPSLLLLSLRRPRLRYALVLPSSLVGLPLLAISAGSLATEPAARAGWLLLSAGILLGGVLGIWFWFRWLPVPAFLHDPFSRGRWLLVGLHISLVVGGLALVGVSAMT